MKPKFVVLECVFFELRSLEGSGVSRTAALDPRSSPDPKTYAIFWRLRDVFQISQGSPGPFATETRSPKREPILCTNERSVWLHSKFWNAQLILSPSWDLVISTNFGKVPRGSREKLNPLAREIVGEADCTPTNPASEHGSRNFPASFS